MTRELPLPPRRGKVGMGVMRLKYRMPILERTTPSLTLPCIGEGTTARKF
jgi:hypothetical protein